MFSKRPPFVSGLEESVFPSGASGYVRQVVHSPQSPAPARDKEKAQAEKENQVANNLRLGSLASIC